MAATTRTATTTTTTTTTTTRRRRTRQKTPEHQWKHSQVTCELLQAFWHFQTAPRGPAHACNSSRHASMQHTDSARFGALERDDTYFSACPIIGNICHKQSVWTIEVLLLEVTKSVFDNSMCACKCISDRCVSKSVGEGECAFASASDSDLQSHPNSPTSQPSGAGPQA